MTIHLLKEWIREAIAEHETAFHQPSADPDPGDADKQFYKAVVNVPIRPHDEIEQLRNKVMERETKLSAANLRIEQLEKELTLAKSVIYNQQVDNNLLR
jgi:hypothetical protein